MAAPYAEPVAAGSIDECYYYHTMEVPGYGVVRGEWDLRGGVDAYLGNEPLAGKRVLEVGTASGFLCFEMERRGAEVVAYDLGPGDPWDVVPFGGSEPAERIAELSRHVERLHKTWWFNHAAFGSRARAVYGTVYEIPRSIGRVDVCTFGSVLMHVRDPFLALQRASALEPRTMIVTEPAWRRSPRALVEGAARRRSPLFLPNAQTGEPRDGWWYFTPEAVANMLAILGYRAHRVVRHTQLYREKRTPMFTVVAHRAGNGS